uniref:Uncharacterized protein n=1 Tax=Macrostomum lignano TaxID=282301 RepID=A0A1I8JA30_9PLAT
MGFKKPQSGRRQIWERGGGHVYSSAATGHEATAD